MRFKYTEHSKGNKTSGSPKVLLLLFLYPEIIIIIIKPTPDCLAFWNGRGFMLSFWRANHHQLTSFLPAFLPPSFFLSFILNQSWFYASAKGKINQVLSKEASGLFEFPGGWEDVWTAQMPFPANGLWFPGTTAGLGVSLGKDTQGLFGPNARRRTEKSMPSCAETSMLKISFPGLKTLSYIQSKSKVVVIPILEYLLSSAPG